MHGDKKVNTPIFCVNKRKETTRILSKVHVGSFSFNSSTHKTKGSQNASELCRFVTKVFLHTTGERQSTCNTI